MKNALLSYQTDFQPHTTPLPPYLFEEHRESWFLVWWYRLTVPSSLDMLAPPEAQERFRQSHTISHILLITLLLVVFSFPASFLNPLLIPILTTTFVVLLSAVILNRLGKITLSSVVVVTILELGVMGGIITTLESSYFPILPLLDMLEVPLLVAVSLLPIRWSFGVALFNCLFITLIFVWVSQTSDFALALHQTYISIVSVPILLQGTLFGIALLWKHKTNKALARADRAEVIAHLEHDLVNQGRIVMEQKQQLEEGIQQIIDTHLCIAQGDLTARVPLHDTHMLWQVAELLNTLLTRYQYARQAENEVQRTRIAVDYLLRAVRNAKQHRHAVVYEQTGTVIDALGAELQHALSTSNKEHPLQ